MKRVLIGVGIGVFLALMGLGIFGEHGLLRLYRLRAEQKALEKEKERLEQERETLSKKIEMLKSDLKYLEQQARKKLGMIKPDEVIIKLPEDEANSVPASPEQNSSPKSEEKKN